jgi:hypothetical protein
VSGRIDARGWQHVEAARNRISVFTAWRRGGALVASVSLAALAFGWLGMVGPLAGLGIAVAIIAGANVSLHRFAQRCSVRCELADIPAVARRRRSLCSSRRRRTLASSLRSLALPSRRERTNPYVLWDRASLVAEQLLALADELEPADNVDPRTILELDRLLCDGRDSPLFNPQRPASELASRLVWIRFRLITGCSGAVRRTSVPAEFDAKGPDGRLWHHPRTGVRVRSLQRSRLGTRRR